MGKSEIVLTTEYWDNRDNRSPVTDKPWQGFFFSRNRGGYSTGYPYRLGTPGAGHVKPVKKQGVLIVTEQNENENLDTGQAIEIPADAKVEHTAAFQGLLGDKKAETARRQAAEEDNARLREDLAAKGETSEIPAETLADDDLMTVGEFKRQSAAKDAAAAEAATKKEAEALKARYATTAVEARSKFSAEKVGADLSYQKVIESVNQLLTPGDWKSVEDSANPAEEAYRLCIHRSPMLQEKQKQTMHSKLLAEITSKGGSPRSGGGSAADSEDDDYSTILHSSKSDKELLAMAKAKGD